MGYGTGWSMIGSGAGLFLAIFWIVILVDLVLLGVWLWQKITKK